ncbi:hypothetical protein K7X08_018174 [Anisodus acutangulus]|uniref:Uncharacterized protein n=1 Tax=Anisodus acutangulus TaxID=402998 RepID=A0A9Q1LX85_9SOLA|nr:hypothetical protein K7X08_018174 [Anisodus acutangulus]
MDENNQKQQQTIGQRHKKNSTKVLSSDKIIGNLGQWNATKDNRVFTIEKNPEKLINGRVITGTTSVSGVQTQNKFDVLMTDGDDKTKDECSAKLSEEGKSSQSDSTMDGETNKVNDKELRQLRKSVVIQATKLEEEGNKDKSDPMQNIEVAQEGNTRTWVEESFGKGSEHQLSSRKWDDRVEEEDTKMDKVQHELNNMLEEKEEQAEEKKGQKEDNMESNSPQEDGEENMTGDSSTQCSHVVYNAELVEVIIKQTAEDTNEEVKESGKARTESYPPRTERREASDAEGSSMTSRGSAKQIPLVKKRKDSSTKILHDLVTPNMELVDKGVDIDNSKSMDSTEEDLEENLN